VFHSKDINPEEDVLVNTETQPTVGSPTVLKRPATSSSCSSRLNRFLSDPSEPKDKKQSLTARKAVRKTSMDL
jgi:hypothetical protein